jgi:hypothetical protein
MPLPNFHACRLQNPGLFDQWAVENKGTRRVVIGRKKDSQKWEAQSIRYDKNAFTEAEARKKCQENDGILFEPASEAASGLHEFQEFAPVALTQSEVDQLLAGKSIEPVALVTGAAADAVVEESSGGGFDESKMQTEDIDNVEILKPGVFVDSVGKQVRVTAKDVREMVANVSLMPHIRPRFKLSHLDDKTHKVVTSLFAFGWLKNIRLVGDTIVTDIKKVPKKVAALIRKGSLRDISAEFWPKYYDSVTKKVVPNVLTAAGVLGSQVPAVKTLDDMIALFSEGTVPEAIRDYMVTAGLEPQSTEPVMLAEYTHKGGDYVELTPEELDRKLQQAREDATKDATNAILKQLSEALGLDGKDDPIKAVAQLKKEGDEKSKTLDVKLKEAFDAKTDSIIYDATRDKKMLPAEKDGYKSMVDGWRVAMLAEGKTDDDVHDRLVKFFEEKPALDIELDDEKGKHKEGETVPDKAIPRDVVAFTERDPQWKIDGEDAEEAEKIDELVRKGATYEEAFCEVTGATPIDALGPTSAADLERVRPWRDKEA